MAVTKEKKVVESSGDVGEPSLDSVTPTAAKLLSLISGEIPLLVFGLTLMILAEAVNLATPILIGKAYDSLQNYFFTLGSNSSYDGEDANYEDVDEVTDRATMEEINLWMGLAIGIFGLSMIAGYTRGVVLGVVGERLVSRLRARTYKSVLRQEIGFFDSHKTGEIVSRLGNDTQLLQQTVSTFVPESLVGFIKIIVSMVLMFSISAKLTGMALGGMVVLCLICSPFGKRMAELSKRYQDVLGDAQTRSTEALGNIRTVQSFVAEPKEMKRYLEKIGDPDTDTKKSSETTYSVGVQKVITQTAFYTIIFGGGFGFLYCSLWYGFYLVCVEGSLSLGGLSAFQSYIFIIGGAIGQTSNNVAQVFSGIGACGRVFYLLERKPNIVNIDKEEEGNTSKLHDDEGKRKHDSIMKVKDDEEEVTSSSDELLTVKSTASTIDGNDNHSAVGNITFENVHFTYPTRPDVTVLKGFTLELKRNTTTALVGSSGSGKSTVVSLIQRFYDIAEDGSGGTIKLDGVDITKLDMSFLRSQIGYVQQEPQLFGMSIRDNLLYGLSEEKASNITDKELDQVCRDANAYEFIHSWPEKYDTMVGERGITLSGGQKQRLAIGRALLTNCRILLLDEATSALDAESEGEVQRAIENAMKGRTVVIVAHRLSTIKNADQIVVMDSSRIVDVGSHDHLLSKCRRYQDLIKRQSTMARDVSTATLQKLIPSNFTIDEETDDL